MKDKGYSQVKKQKYPSHHATYGQGGWSDDEPDVKSTGPAITWLFVAIIAVALFTCWLFYASGGG